MLIGFSFFAFTEILLTVFILNLLQHLHWLIVFIIKTQEYD